MMRRPAALFIVLFAAYLTACGSERPAPESGITLYEGARLILGDGRVLETGSLLGEGSRIVAVGASDEVGASPGATVVDLAGKTVMPALIDAPAHLGYEG
jgi:imidazolonepropionase-like amidohydrolase